MQISDSRKLSTLITLKEIRYFGIGVDDVVELLGEIVPHLLHEGENVVADFVVAVLLLAENCQGGEDDAFQELQQDFVALSVNEVERLEDVFVLDVVLAEREVRDEDGQDVFEGNQSAVDEDQTPESSTDVVENSAVTFLCHQRRKCFEDLWICSVEGKIQELSKVFRFQNSLEADLSTVHDHFTERIHRVVSNFLVTSIVQKIDELRKKIVEVLS